MAREPVRYVSAEKKTHDDFGVAYSLKEGEFVYDGCMKMSSQWATMSETSWAARGCGLLGTGRGQKYRRTADGIDSQLVKVAG